LSSNGGLAVLMRDSNDADLKSDAVGAMSPAQTKTLNGAAAAYTDMFAAGPLTITGISGMTRADAQLTLPATVYKALVLKPGPVITGVQPGAGPVFPLGAAPGEIISIYGNGLANSQVSMNGTAMQIYYDSDTLINAIVPDNASGYATLTVQN